MSSKHLQQHNVWPTGFTVVWAIGLIFVAGQLFSQFDTLKQDFKDYRIQTTEQIKSIQTDIYDLKVNAGILQSIPKGKEVLGVATPSATLKVTPSATPRPPVRPTPTAGTTP